MEIQASIKVAQAVEPAAARTDPSGEFNSALKRASSKGDAPPGPEPPKSNANAGANPKKPNATEKTPDQDKKKPNSEPVVAAQAIVALGIPLIAPGLTDPKQLASKLDTSSGPAAVGQAVAPIVAPQVSDPVGSKKQSGQPTNFQTDLPKQAGAAGQKLDPKLSELNVTKIETAKVAQIQAAGVQEKPQPEVPAVAASNPKKSADSLAAAVVKPVAETKVEAPQPQAIPVVEASSAKTGGSSAGSDFQGDRQDSANSKAPKLEATPTAVAQPTQATVAAEEAKPPQLPTPVPTHQVIRQIADHVEVLAAKAQSNVTIHLQPENLGAITLTMRSAGDRIDAEIHATNDSVRLALEANRGDLYRAINEKGLSMGSLNVGSQATPQQQHQQNASRQDFQRLVNMRRADPIHIATTHSSPWQSRQMNVDYVI